MISWPRHAPLHRLDSMSVLSTVTFQAIDLPAGGQPGFRCLAIGAFYRRLLRPDGYLPDATFGVYRATCQTRHLTCHLSEGQMKREASSASRIHHLHTWMNVYNVTQSFKPTAILTASLSKCGQQAEIGKAWKQSLRCGTEIAANLARQ